MKKNYFNLWYLKLTQLLDDHPERIFNKCQFAIRRADGLAAYLVIEVKVIAEAPRVFAMNIVFHTDAFHIEQQISSTDRERLYEQAVLWVVYIAENQGLTPYAFDPAERINY